MEQVPALRQHPQHVGVLVLRQAYRAARGCSSLVKELGLREDDLRVAHQRGLVKSGFDVRHRTGEPSRRRPGRGGVGSSTAVECKSDGDNEKQHTDGGAGAVTDSADPICAEHADRVSTGEPPGVHDLVWVVEPSRSTSSTLTAAIAGIGDTINLIVAYHRLTVRSLLLSSQQLLGRFSSSVQIPLCIVSTPQKKGPQHCGPEVKEEREAHLHYSGFLIFSFGAADPPTPTIARGVSLSSIPRTVILWVPRRQMWCNVVLRDP
ncbi:hypothetical protein B296_00030667 [Ensete ventricosum]|uniref:Uncharacterized protein n=1 Tax=Ensete ventricosum TaxID=4639 RepID=A0A426XSS3_ENSVE|nr:hypothetical protein B296_00030667 [Ensete ventricosum]